MERDIVQIDERKCNGCGLCVKACHEGAIAMVNGKAKLIRDDYCDGLGDCLPECPTGAITIEKREALAYDKEAVEKKMAQQPVCPGSQMQVFERRTVVSPQPERTHSQLQQWPVQIQLVPVQASFYENAKLLIAADCTAYAYADFHKDFIKDHVVLIGCPKLDPVDYTDKLEQIIANHSIRSVKIVRMDVPCCGGLEHAATTALQNSGKFIPWQVVTISRDGRILEDE